jgi:arylsulfatase A
MYFKQLAFLFIALYFSASYARGQSSSAEQAPNIVILFADDMGYGDLSSYGHPLIRTDRLDQMAEEGIRLTSFYVAAPSCTPSRAALLTGRYPLRSGMPRVIFPKSQKGLPASEVTLAEALKAQGYRTMCIGKWHLGDSKKEFLPTGQGFDHYYGLITSNDMMRPWVKTDVPLRLYRDSIPTEEYPVDQHRLTTRYTAEAVKFIKESKDSPFFLYLPYNMPHVPIATADNFRGQSAAGLYGDVIETIDWSAGQILKTLKEHGLDENTIVIFTSDNGPWSNMPPRMFQEDIVKPWHAGSAGHLRGAKGTSYEGGFQVPCIIRWPGKIPEKQVSAQVATSMDLYTTLIHAAGGEIPQDREVDGVDVMPIFMGDTAFRREKDFYYFQGENLEAIRSAEWKLRIAPYMGREEPGNKELVPELYNLLLDPSEQINRADDHPEIVTGLKEKMQNFKIEGAKLRFQ